MNNKDIQIKQFGTVYGGFYYPENLDGLDENSIIYCVGAGEDITHDISVANQLNSKVYIFDPTPRAIEHVKYVKEVFAGTKKPIDNYRYGGGDKNYWTILNLNKISPENIILKEYGLFTSDKVMKFYKPTNPDWVSCSLVKGMTGAESIDVPVKSLNTIMKELNHTTIDLLKLDIEGCEDDIINKMLDDGIFPKYLSVDFDLCYNKTSVRDPIKCTNTIKRLLSIGYKKIYQRGQDWSFKKF